jgi:hypothetical protein
MFYNFRIAPEAFWPILAAVGTAVLVELQSTDYTTITDWRTWALGFGVTLVFRTIPGAILAIVSKGGFQLPGQPAKNEPVG